ncbi:holdfast attachment protein C [alpha proteobacterium IMCC14465]|uniref:Holdfast attachment protein C n=1 Tax=alpha proteobacterium IMCC14465 TaxID=1220535 RepID=J9DIR9_9PROT|nr:holdfast attachment protein C [alpha proteobacterium IMCC14465]
MSSPPILYLQDVSLTFGVTPLLEGADLSVAQGERLCVVGRNGSGKSTLLKIAAGLVEPDSGERFVQPGIMVSYLDQDPIFTGSSTIGDYVLSDLMDNEDKQRAYQLMADLRLTPEQGLENLSGGERRRVALAKVMAPDPDILLLDEPTNHLDLPAIEWLENALKSLRSALVLISHDRRFLSNMSQSTLWLDRGKTSLLKKGFGYFEDWRDEELELELTRVEKLDRKIEREEHWVRHGVSGRRKRNVKRLADLAMLKKQRRDHQGPAGNMKAQISDAEMSGKLVIKADKIAKSFEGKTIVTQFSTQIKRGDRVGLVGANGVGKTTLLNMLIGEMAPDIGNVRLGKNLQMLVLDQARAGIKRDWTIKDALTDGAGDYVTIGEDKMHVIGYMKDFLFHPSQMRTPANVLSGGELARLLLARGLRHPSNVLIMDEPTNDLDLETLDLLQELIADYQGTVILVSHDRDFLDRTVSSVIYSEGEGLWIEYAGGYSDMLIQRKAGQEPRIQENAKEISKSTESKNLERDVKAGPPILKAVTKLSYKQKYALEQLPLEMAELEKLIEESKKLLSDSTLFTKDPDLFSKTAAALDKSEARLIEAEAEWLELEILREELEG